MGSLNIRDGEFELMDGEFEHKGRGVWTLGVPQERVGEFEHEVGGESEYGGWGVST